MSRIGCRMIRKGCRISSIGRIGCWTCIIGSRTGKVRLQDEQEKLHDEQDEQDRTQDEQDRLLDEKDRQQDEQDRLEKPRRS
jgi:hypothetical protein